MTLREMFTQIGINCQNAILDQTSGEWLYFNFDLTPDQLLERAEDNFQQGTDTSLVDAIANAKRAIECQVDEALLCLGYRPNRWNFPRKMDKLSSLGFIAPRIVSRVITLRNRVEHEYIVPRHDQVEEALDICQLFLGAAKRHLQPFMGNFVISGEDMRNGYGFTQELLFQFVTAPSPHFFIRCVKDTNDIINITEGVSQPKRVLLGEMNLHSSDSIYDDIMRVVLSDGNERKQSHYFDILLNNILGCDQPL